MSRTYVVPIPLLDEGQSTPFDKFPRQSEMLKKIGAAIVARLPEEHRHATRRWYAAGFVRVDGVLHVKLCLGRVR